MKKQIVACIDGSALSGSVSDSAVWASQILDAPLKFLHVLEKQRSPTQDDLSGTIGLDSREQLLSELTLLDEKRNRLAIEHGQQLLETIRQRAASKGVTDVITEQRHDQLLNALLECESSTRLFVIGRQGSDHDNEVEAIGSHIENVVRSIHTPVLMATGKFNQPENYMLAYDGSETANTAIDRVANSPLLKDLPGHIVMVGDDKADNQQKLEHVSQLMIQKGHSIQSHLIDSGHVVNALNEFQKVNHIEFIVMGAYGHSRIREFFVGSNTTKILATSKLPVLILR